MIRIQQDPNFVQNNLHYINKQLCSIQSTLQNIISCETISLDSLVQAVSDSSSLDSMLMFRILRVLFTRCVNPGMLVGHHVKEEVQKVLKITSLLLSVPHDQDEFIKICRQKKQAIKNRQSESKDEQDEQIDAQFVLMLAWLYGEKQNNIALVELIIDVYAVDFILAQRNNQQSSLCLQKWHNHLKLLAARKQQSIKLQQKLQNLNKDAENTQNYSENIIHIPL